MFGNGVTSQDILAQQVVEQWDLISKLLADDVHRARYRQLLGTAMNGLLNSASFEKRARTLHDLIAPAVLGPQGEQPTHTTVASSEAFE